MDGHGIIDTHLLHVRDIHFLNCLIVGGVYGSGADLRAPPLIFAETGACPLFLQRYCV